MDQNTTLRRLSPRGASRRVTVSDSAYACPIELLEREDALAALVEAHDAAALGYGRAVFVAGGAGVGKTSLLGRFIGERGPGTRVLTGTCDDLSVPRPLGPLRDLAGSVSAALAE